MRCQARALDRSTFGSEGNIEIVPPCDGLAEVPFRGFVLCVGCMEALDTICALGEGGLFDRIEEANPRLSRCELAALVLAPMLLVGGLILASLLLAPDVVERPERDPHGWARR